MSAGRYEVRQLPQEIRASSLDLFGVWEGKDWVRQPGPPYEPAWFVTAELAQREAAQRNRRRSASLEQPGGFDGEGVGDEDDDVDRGGVGAELGAIDGVAVEA